MLSIVNLYASVDGKAILKGLSLELPTGQVHAVMGPNGSGKSTLSRVICGHPDYVVTEGSITYDGVDLLAMPIEEREQRFLLRREGIPVPREARTIDAVDDVEARNFLLDQRPLVNPSRAFEQ